MQEEDTIILDIVGDPTTCPFIAGDPTTDTHMAGRLLRLIDPSGKVLARYAVTSWTSYRPAYARTKATRLTLRRVYPTSRPICDDDDVTG